MNPSQSQYEKTRDWGTLREAQSDSSSVRPTEDALAYIRQYAREKPEAFGLWCFGIGFVLGWKLKLW